MRMDWAAFSDSEMLADYILEMIGEAQTQRRYAGVRQMYGAHPSNKPQMPYVAQNPRRAGSFDIKNVKWMSPG